MTGSTPLSDESETSASERIEYYEDLIQRLARETITSYALRAYAEIIHASSTEITGDYFAWPFVGNMQDASLCDEMTFIFKEAGSDQFEYAYASYLHQFAEKVTEQISDAEQDLLWEAALLESKQSMTTTEMQDWIITEVIQEIVEIAKHGSTETIIETLSSNGIVHRPLPYDEEVI